MINIEEAKGNMLKDVQTPSGNLKLYGINFLPTIAERFGLIFYVDGKQKIFWNIDCTIKAKASEHTEGSSVNGAVVDIGKTFIINTDEGL